MLRADLPADERRWLMLDADAVLGLDLHGVWDTIADDSAAAGPVSEVVAALLAARDAARAARDFDRADALRNEIASHGWDVVDGAGGSSVKPRLGQIPPPPP
ncbi:MAG: CysS/YqeB C-terminal domain-containing protein [Candidatus Limnocylindrales bacterium]